MIIRKPSLLLAACNSFHSFSPNPSISSTSSNPSRQRGTRQPARVPQRDRGYATIANEHGEPQGKQDAEHVWPETPKGHRSPTPYQILDTKSNVAYTKAKYYQLVKLYHPDLNSKVNHDITDKVKMERYRLIVAAHAILSDPVKRSAYDRFGAGWNGKSEVGNSNAWRHGGSGGQSGPFSQNWNDPGDPIWQNATWEDWERWRSTKEGVYSEKRAPVYMANSYFLACIVALAVIGSSMNYGRAQDAGHYFIEQRDIVHDRAAKELRRVRQETAGLTSRQDRIDYFVRQREATLGAGDYDAVREERANRILKDREVCSSEEVRNSTG